MPETPPRLSLLEELDERQDEVIRELEQLDKRIDHLIKQWVGERTPTGEAA